MIAEHVPRGVVVWAPLLLFCNPALADQPGDFFESRVRPVLAKNCLSCHGSSKMGGLRIDSRDLLTKGGNDGPVIVPGDPDNSVLIQAVRRTHPRWKMPPQAPLANG